MANFLKDFLTRVVESSAGKYDNIQQILNRYDSVAFTKRQIVRNHMEVMFKLDVLQENLVSFFGKCELRQFIFKIPYYLINQLLIY